MARYNNKGMAKGGMAKGNKGKAQKPSMSPAAVVAGTKAASKGSGAAVAQNAMKQVSNAGRVGSTVGKVVAGPVGGFVGRTVAEAAAMSNRRRK